MNRNLPSLQSFHRIIGVSCCALLAIGACFADEPAPKASALSELSVAPLQHQFYPDDRPEWIVADPVLEGPQHRWAVASSPALTEEASMISLTEQKRIAVAAYLSEVLGTPDPPFKIDDQQIDRQLVNPDRIYHGEVTTSDGVMYEDAVELVFDQDFRDGIQKRWRRYERRSRLAGLGVLGAGGFALLLGMTGVLKVVSRSRGSV